MTDISHKSKIKEAGQFCHPKPEPPGYKSGTSGFARQNWPKTTKHHFITFYHTNKHHILV